MVSSVARSNASNVSIAAARITIAAAVPRRAAVAARSAAAAHRAITTTTSTPVRRWLRPRIRITRCAVRATSCSRIRRRSARIECESHGRWRALNVKQQLVRRRNPPTELAHCSGGKAEGGRGKRFPAFTLCFCNCNSNGAKGFALHQPPSAHGRARAAGLFGESRARRRISAKY
jgi:hypothetical protein